MSLNFIDIASWQAGINLDAVLEQNPLNGIIVKSTQSINYVNPYCDKWVQWAIKKGLPWGFYHFLDYTDPVEEAKFYIKHTINYFKDGVPVADYEGSIVSAYGTYYLRRFLETVYDETGIKPLVYCNLSTIQGDVNGFRAISESGFKLWLAQYSYNAPSTFVAQPWQQGSYAPFKTITMHQYSSNGHLNGYNGNLDLDIFYGTADDWAALAGTEAIPEPITDMGRDAIIDAIIELLEKLR